MKMPRFTFGLKEMTSLGTSQGHWKEVRKKEDEGFDQSVLRRGLALGKAEIQRTIRRENSLILLETPLRHVPARQWCGAGCGPCSVLAGRDSSTTRVRRAEPTEKGRCS